MFTFLLTVSRLLMAFFRGFQDKEFQALFVLTLFLLIGGSIFYIQVEGWDLIDALYFCVVTLTTVGYGDLAPVTPLGKIFTMVYLLSGVGILVGFASKVAQHSRRQP